MKDQRIVPFIPDRNMLNAASIYTDQATFLQAYQAALDVAPQPEPIGAGDLTKRQRDVLDFLVKHFRENKRAPSLDEIGAGIGIEKSAVHGLVKALRRNGFISMSRKKRSIKVKPHAYTGENPNA